MPGEASALLTAALWAVSIVIFTAQSRRVDAIPLNALRSLFAAVFILLIIPFSGAMGELREMSAATAVAMVGSGILAMGIGDSFYFSSLAIIGASRSVPISIGIYPWLTFLIAAIWLDEEVTWLILLGTALIMVGVTLLVRERGPVAEGDTDGSSAGREAAASGRWRKGLLLVLLASVTWALSTTWLKAGSGDLGAVAAGGLRVMANTLFLMPLAYRWRGSLEIGDYGVRNIAAIAIAGILGIGIGSLLYVYAVQEAGAGKTAILTSTMPLFSLPLAVLFLREKVTLTLVLGTILCILGIWLII